MEVKGIFGKIHHQEVKKYTPYFALQIEEGLVKSALWVVRAGVVKILSLGEAVAWQDDNELLEAVDKSISAASENLDTSEIEEPNKVILGVPFNWAQDNKIHPEYLEKFRHIFKELELTPSGFVVTVEALVHYLKSTEGIPPTAILLGLRKDNLIVALVKLGKIVGVEIVRRSDSLESDLLEGLSRFPGETSYPARILLYDTDEDLEEVKQRLIAYPWQSAKISFLHLPKIEVLPFDFDIKAVALAGGKEIAQAQSVQSDYPSRGNQPIDSTDNNLPQTAKDEVVDFDERDGDQSEVSENEVEEITKDETENLGFLVGQDIAEVNRVVNLPTTQSDESSVNPMRETFPEDRQESQTPKFKINISKIRSFVRFPRIKINLGKFQSIPVIILLVLLCLAGVGIAAYWYLPKATIRLTVRPNNLEKTITIKLDPSATEIDKEELIIPGQQTTISLEVSKSQSTTGTTTIGESAKGEVIIYNRTDAEKKFASGVLITGPNSLKFSLDTEVTIASQSAGSDYSLVPGKATVKVTAVKIGPESNLAADSEFSVDKYSRSDFIAKSNGEFTGGTSREVQAVAKSDLESLRKNAVEELKAKALSEFLSKISPETQIIEDSLVDEIDKENFSLKAGEEGDSLSLDIKVKFSALVYDKAQLQSITEDEVKKSVPSGYSYSPSDNDFSFGIKEVDKNNVATVEVGIKTKLIPVIDHLAIQRDLVGKYPTLAYQYLQNIPNVSNVEIVLRPKLPGKIGNLPRVEKNINIEVQTE